MKITDEDRDWTRSLYRAAEAIHIVTYFTKECRAANRALGTTGFWMGYFGSRGAPMGEASGGAIQATFYNFRPQMVLSEVPSVWKVASPETFLEVRSRSAGEALVTQTPTVSEVPLSLVGALEGAISQASPSGRPLFGGNQGLDVQEQSGEVRLWQACTAIREHRGDGHVALLVVNNISGLQSHLLKESHERMSSSTLQNVRGWNAEEYALGMESLQEAHLIDGEGALTAKGRELRGAIEHGTDSLSMDLLQFLPSDDRGEALRTLEYIASQLAPVGR